MKLILLTTVFLSLGVNAQGHYEPNDGVNPPGTFSTKAGTKDASTTAEPNGLKSSTGITTEEINTSPNPAPKTEQEVIDNSTLTNERVYQTTPYSNKPEEIEAQEEDALDYSTAPDKDPIPQKKEIEREEGQIKDN